MNATPRISSGAFPQTPGPRDSTAKSPPRPSPQSRASAASAPASNSRQSLPPAPQPDHGQPASQPLIPLTVLDAPTQRLYAFAAYLALFAWKLYDWMQLVEGNAEALWLFLKWVAIDLVFLFGLPELRIPWLELSQPVTAGLFFCHALFDFMLSFNIAVPWMAWIPALVKMFYDSELSISENYVKSSRILHNTSLIQGSHSINILPEGSAMLNPDRTPFCIGGGRTTVLIPLQFNATVPREVEIVRIDLDVGSTAEEVVKLSRSQLRSIEHMVRKAAQDQADHPATVLFELPVKKTGAYKLRRVLDEYKLEVQRNSPHTLVVPCPSASIAPAVSVGRCVKDLSDLVINVDGTPPLNINYSRTVNGKDHSFHFQSLQPEGFSSPLTGAVSSSLVVGDEEEISWARSQRVTVNLNESLYTPGDWRYSIEEVRDAFGNVVKYPSPADDPDAKPKAKHLVQHFMVEGRPKVHLTGCDIRNPLKAARHDRIALPIEYEGRDDNRVHTLTWEFSPIDTLTNNGDPGDVVETGSHSGRRSEGAPLIRYSGLYTLKTVRAGSCEGEVQEPSSCLLLNPPEPELTIRARDIPDTCAGNSVGLIVDLDLVGTPPFIVRYDVMTNGRSRSQAVRIEGLRHQMKLIPKVPGTHKYVFQNIDDKYYKFRGLYGPDMVLSQSVKPAASASIYHPYEDTAINACLEEQIDLEVDFLGEPPFALDYELIHDGKRTPYKVTDVQSNKLPIRTPPLVQGGEYTVSLASVQDRRGCRVSLQDEVKIAVRRQRPRAAFGMVDGQRKLLSIENRETKLPLRLTGVGPWKVKYQNRDQPGKAALSAILRNSNDHISVLARGVYEILEVKDNQCQGHVDPKAADFVVDWFPRPTLQLATSPSISGGISNNNKYEKKDVCEGEVDGFEILFSGAPPFHVAYKIHHKPAQGSASGAWKELDTAQAKAVIAMDTTKPGLYTYSFVSLGDDLYALDEKDFSPLVLTQRVNARPTATFDKPGQVFKYCASEQDHEDRIPITLTGVPPFFVELEIKHQSGVVSQVHHVAAIDSHSYSVQIPRELLRLGSQQVRIREVRDARGCHSRFEPYGGGSGGAGASGGGAHGAVIHVQLFDAPAIYPLETRTDYCVGERIAYTLSGMPPFEVEYTFDGTRRSAKSPTTTFRRLADSPGVFSIASVRDRASECRGAVELVKTVHPMPSVRISHGRDVSVAIHEGGEVEILFEFGGTPPFEFTYTRSTYPQGGAGSKRGGSGAGSHHGGRPEVRETRHDISYEHSKVLRASQAGIYEVVAIKDKYCAYSKQQVAISSRGDLKDGAAAEKLLQY